MAALLDRYLPCPDVRSRHSIVIHASPDVVLDVARSFDINSIALVRAIFWLRSKLLRAQAYDPPDKGLVDWLLELGWQRLAEEPGRYFVAGAACQPWQPNVVFSPMDAKPNHVQIAWTLDAEPVGPAQTLFSTETRVAAVDEEARARFRHYWRIFRIGILLIRRLLLPAIRREAERQYQPQRHEPPFAFDPNTAARTPRTEPWLLSQGPSGCTSSNCRTTIAGPRQQARHSSPQLRQRINLVKRLETLRPLPKQRSSSRVDRSSLRD